MGTPVPFAANGSVPEKGFAASTATYTGNFTVVFDGKGKNLAPVGTMSVTFDEKTNKRIRFE